MMQKDIFDPEKFTSYTGNDPHDIISMGELFFKQSDSYLEVMASAIANDNLEIWSNTAHKMKGMASFVGAGRLHDSCQQAETAGEGQGLMLDIIKMEVMAVRKALSDFLQHVRSD